MCMHAHIHTGTHTGTTSTQAPTQAHAQADVRGRTHTKIQNMQLKHSYFNMASNIWAILPASNKAFSPDLIVQTHLWLNKYCDKTRPGDFWASCNVEYWLIGASCMGSVTFNIDTSASGYPEIFTSSGIESYLEIKKLNSSLEHWQSLKIWQDEQDATCQEMFPLQWYHYYLHNIGEQCWISS